MKPVLTIGRSSSCDIILDGEKISREHARISIAGGKYVFQNVGRYGSYMNGVLLGNEKIVIAPNAEIMLAGTTPLPWTHILKMMPLKGIVVK
ncbi:MAG: FHA domain-containing protein [Bacteroidaceae bacterium]|nr:FHA domain-containing protein [Bacteroidaceae bacterium]